MEATKERRSLSPPVARGCAPGERNGHSHLTPYPETDAQGMGTAPGAPPLRDLLSQGKAGLALDSYLESEFSSSFHGFPMIME